MPVEKFLFDFSVIRYFAPRLNPVNRNDYPCVFDKYIPISF